MIAFNSLDEIQKCDHSSKTLSSTSQWWFVLHGISFRTKFWDFVVPGRCRPNVLIIQTEVEALIGQQIGGPSAVIRFCCALSG